MKNMKNSKKLMSVILILSLFLTACSGVMSVNPDRLKLDKAYEFTANIQHGESNTAANFSRKNAGSWEITLLEPFALEGMTITYDNGIFSAEYQGLESCGVSGTGGENIAEIMIAVFENSINGEGREIISSGEEIIITSKANSKSYELILDKKTLSPLSMKIPDASLTADFSGVQISQIVQVVLAGDVYETGTAPAFITESASPAESKSPPLIIAH